MNENKAHLIVSSVFVVIFVTGVIVGYLGGDKYKEIEAKLYTECLESKKENCKELHDYFNKIMGEE